MKQHRIERYRIIESSLGTFILMASSNGDINSTWLMDDGWAIARLSGAAEDRQLLPDAAEELRRYFRGQEADFSFIPTPDGPAFWRRCWELCRRIPRGRTCSYGEIARLAGRSTTAARAVGQAMRHNPLPVIVPCHRVIASTGGLHGFGGTCESNSDSLALKRHLLELEGWADRPTSHEQPALFESLPRSAGRRTTLGSVVR